jgi:hypothetical protein
LVSRSWSLVGNAVKVCHGVGIQNTASYKGITACNTALGLDHGRKVSYLHSGSILAVPPRMSVVIWTTRSQIFGSRDISVARQSIQCSESQGLTTSTSQDECMGLPQPGENLVLPIVGPSLAWTKSVAHDGCCDWRDIEPLGFLCYSIRTCTKRSRTGKLAKFV